MKNQNELRVLRSDWESLKNWSKEHVLLMLMLILPTLTFTQSTNSEGISDSLTWQHSYDELDRLSKITDPAGRATSYDYLELTDKMIVTKTNDSNSSVTFDYDKQGRITKMTDEAGNVNYGYDAFGRANFIDYDLQDRITKLTVGDSYNVAYSYDFMGQLLTVETDAGIIAYEYWPGSGQVIRKLPNGIQTIWEYDVNGELLKTTHAYRKNTIIAEYQYQYRPDGLLDAKSENTQQGMSVVDYRYDNVGRLVNARYQPGEEYNYEYDMVGNRLLSKISDGTSQNYEYDWAGRLLQINGNECKHDLAGNLTEMLLNGNSLSFQFNQDGQLTQVNKKLKYIYDGMGNMIARDYAGNKSKFITNPLSEYWQPLVVTNQSGEKTQIIWDGNSPLVIINNEEAEFLLTDHLGSVRIVTDKHGNVIRYLDYDPFGWPIGNTNLTGFQAAYAGLFYDGEAKIYLTKARAYQPETGRFLQIEPLKFMPSGSQKEIAHYAYCGNDPVNFVDLDGNWPRWAWGHEDWAWQFRIWEMEKQSKLATELLTNWYQQRGSIYGSWGVEYANQMNYKIHHSAFERFSSISLQFANPYTSVRPELLGASPYATYSALTGVANAFLGGLNTGYQWLNTTTRAMQSSNMPMFISDRHSWGWSGRGVNQITPHIKYAYREEHRASINPFRPSGQISRHHVGTLVTPWGTSTREVKRSVNANTFEEMIYNFAPLQNYADFSDPSYRYESKTTTHESYRVVAKGGVTQYYPSHQITNHQNTNRVASSPVPNPISPSNVGGVYLGGAGAALEGLDQLEGLAIDANNNLVLISKEGENINLPPMRIDDVVAVFRSVYQLGMGPTVTIDPNPDDPENSAMIIRHDEATEGTYVGWILFEADRLMKCYMLGVDNNTTEDIISKIPGYAEVVDAVYFGDGVANTERREGKWERFWIVPAGVNRFSNEKDELTIFDVPLKVNTQVMKWHNGELIDDPTGESSTGAKKFTDWFTANYDKIAGEQYLLPPPETGFTDPVPVFAELKRIATITAVAEKMRDQGIPMPFWMRDHEITTVNFEKYTPGLQITNSKGTITSKIFGGVSLNPEKKEVKQFATIADISQLPEEKKKEAVNNLETVNVLAGTLSGLGVTDKPVSSESYEIQNVTWNTVTLPGSSSKVLMPCTIEETDMLVYLPDGNYIHLSRTFNSFFNPKDIWGSVWTMNLPKLEKFNIVSEDKTGEKFITSAYELIYPLNSDYIRFSGINEVADLNTKLRTPDTECGFYGIGEAKPDFLTISTLNLIGKNGELWHFTQDGELIATELNGFRVIYLRNERGKISQIVGLLGKSILATIDIKYDEQGRIKEAAGKDYLDEIQTITYKYDHDGLLNGVSGNVGKLTYSYNDFKVLELAWMPSSEDADPENDLMIRRSFEYNDNRQLIAEYGPDNVKDGYSISTSETGIKVTTDQSDQGSDNRYVVYDKAYRPVEADYGDGTTVTWNYPETGEKVIAVNNGDETSMLITESADGKTTTTATSEQHVLVETFDNAGRPSEVKINGLIVLKQSWSPLGKLQYQEFDNRRLSPQYDEEGLLKSITYQPPESSNSEEWQTIEFDIAGRPVKINDYSRLNMKMSYDGTGAMNYLLSEREGKNYGYEFIRNENGRIDTINSSWGNEYYEFEPNGDIARIMIRKTGYESGNQSLITFNAGRLASFRQFDGSTFEIEYHEDSDLSGLPMLIKCPNNLLIQYDYNQSENINSAVIGMGRKLDLETDGFGRMIKFSLTNNPN